MDPVQRWDYTGVGLLEDDVPDTPWPLAQDWVDQARKQPDLHEPSAMSFATVDAQGRPDVRTVLMRFFTPNGPGFVSSRHSAKAAEIGENARAAASLTWTPLYRSLRFRGAVVEIDAAETDTYWSTRPWGSRISAWVSRQSHPVESRGELQSRYDDYAARWPDHGEPDDVPVPQDWVGYVLVCDEVEFWAGQPDRLHDRFRFVRDSPGALDEVGAWSWQRLQP